MASRVRLSAPNPEAVEPERPPPALPSELLEEIFLRVASTADLARASAACASFRRLIADHTFLRRYSSTHPPLLLGFVGYNGFHCLRAPHPSAAVSRAVARATDFSFGDYVPLPTNGSRWHPCDIRDGRVLVGSRSGEGPACWDLAVCDPMSRGYMLLPPITDDLLAFVGLQKQNVFRTSASFVPSKDIKEDTSFRVIFWMQSNTRLGVFVFSSVSARWSVSMSTSGDALGLNNIGVLPSGQCMYDCFYWKLCRMSMLIKLDMNTMQFCTVDLPPGHDDRQITIVESGESKLAMFSKSYEGTYVDYYTFSRNGSEKFYEWHMMKSIPLPPNNFIRNLKGPVEGYIFLEGITRERDATEFFSLEIKSFKIERLIIEGFTFCGYPYFGFPPSLSPIRIQGYGELQD